MFKNKVILFQSLSGTQRLWIWFAYWRLWLTLLRIKFNKASWLQGQVEFSGSKVPMPICKSSVALEMYEAVRIAARLHFMSAQCLPKSIVLKNMLRRKGLLAQVRIGVAKTDSGIASHAWVELEGEMVGEAASVSSDFTPLQ